MATPRAPAWVGIGAQRSGTTWFTRLLLRHPAMCLAPGEGTFVRSKELHFFDHVLHDGSTDNLVDTYRDAFAGAEASHPGEFTPSYLRSAWVAGLLQRAAGPETVFICLLRDPVDRFYSAVRWSWHIKEQAPDLYELHNDRGAWSRLVGGDALWGGMYATQLRAWRSLLGTERLVVLQYEAAVKDPATATGAVWAAMGLTPCDLGPPEPSTETASPEDGWGRYLVRIPGLRSQLQSIYRPEVRKLEREWGIDTELWTSAR